MANKILRLGICHSGHLSLTQGYIKTGRLCKCPKVCLRGYLSRGVPLTKQC